MGYLLTEDSMQRMSAIGIGDYDSSSVIWEIEISKLILVLLDIVY